MHIKAQPGGKHTHQDDESPELGSSRQGNIHLDKETDVCCHISALSSCQAVKLSKLSCATPKQGRQTCCHHCQGITKSKYTAIANP